MTWLIMLFCSVILPVRCSKRKIESGEDKRIHNVYCLLKGTFQYKMGFITRSSQLYSFNKNNLEFLRRTLVPNETLAIVLLDLIKRNHFFARGTACPDDLRWAKSLFFVAKSFLQTAQMVWPTFSSSTSLSSFLLRRFFVFNGF